MSSIYLIRHGQAGTRRDYDALSDLGRRQAYLLGGYLAGQGIRFKAVIAGCLNRQRQTAAELGRAYRDAGVPVPDIVSEPRWNEFDMTAVFDEFAPLLRETDPEFKTAHDELLRQLEDENSPLHHAWTDCDTRAMRAWVEGRHPSRTESWAAFCKRVLDCRESLRTHLSGDALAVVTSACPIAIWVARALGLNNGNIMRLAGVMYNSALTTMRLRGDDLMLFSFNGVPHLDDPDLRTFR